MQPARRGGIADGFADSHGERDDIVLHAAFNLMDLRHIDFGARADRGRGVFRDQSSFRESFRRGKLDFQPLGELVRVAPNLAHLLARVAWNQFPLLSGEKTIRRMFPNSMIPHLERASLDGDRLGECPKLGRRMAEASSYEFLPRTARWIRFWPARVCGLIRTGTRVAQGQGVGCLHPGGRMSTALDGTKGGVPSSIAENRFEQGALRRRLRKLLW